MIPVSSPHLTGIEQRLVADCFARNQLTMGPVVRRFEDELASLLRLDHCVACSSGTTALHLALSALNIGMGQEVLVPDLTFVATANAVAYTGAVPVLVDVDPISWCIDLADAQRKVTFRTAAIIPVHLYGVPADMHAVNQFASQHHLHVIEDAAEGFGGHYHGVPLGGLSTCGVFSFYGNKVITTGEGGAVVTNDPDLDARLRLLRGQALDPGRRYFHTELGYNYRMTDVQAAIGLGQLSHLEDMMIARHAIMAHYSRRLSRIGATPAPMSAPWLFTISLDRDIPRDGLAAELMSHGIETRPVFQPLHRMPMYSNHNGWFLHDDKFPRSAYFADTGISLPTFPALPLKAVDTICDIVLEFAARHTGENDRHDGTRNGCEVGC